MTAPAGHFWLAVVLAGLVTYAVRAIFFLFADRMTALPPAIREVLRMIPAAALAALAIPPLLRPDGAETAITLLSADLVAGVLAGLTAWRTRSLALTIAVGIGAVLVLEPLLA